MKLSTIIAATVAVFAPAIQAQYASVLNNCTFNVFVQSYPYSGAKPGPVVTLAPGSSPYVQAYVAGGTTLKMGTTALLQKPLFFGYSLTSSPNNVYFELKDQYGNPFKAYYNDLAASRLGCQKFDCAPGSKTCYSHTGNSKIYACPRPTNLTATLCAAS